MSLRNAPRRQQKRAVAWHRRAHNYCCINSLLVSRQKLASVEDTRQLLATLWELKQRLVSEDARVCQKALLFGGGSRGGYRVLSDRWGEAATVLALEVVLSVLALAYLVAKVPPAFGEPIARAAEQAPGRVRRKFVKYPEGFV